MKIKIQRKLLQNKTINNKKKLYKGEIKNLKKRYF